MLPHRLHLLLYFFSIQYIYLKRQTKCELQRQKIAKPCLHLLKMTLSVLETSLAMKKSHETLASGISAKNWRHQLVT